MSPLSDSPLKELRCDFEPNRDTEILRSIKTLEKINGLPVAEFWKQVEAGNIPSPTTGLPGSAIKESALPATDDAFIKEVAALPAEQQVVRVVAKLKELNPGYDGKEEHKIKDGQVAELKVPNTSINDISPVRALVNLRSLWCGGLSWIALSPLVDLTVLQGVSLSELNCNYSEVSNLSPLRDMSLKRLHCAGCRKLADLTPLKGLPLEYLSIPNTPVRDLSPLRGMPLDTLLCYGTKVTDLSPLKEVSVKWLQYDCDPKRDTEILRSIKTLERINYLPVAEFWRQVEAGSVPGPWPNRDNKQE